MSKYSLEKEWLAMKKKLCEFIGVQCNEISEADKKISTITEQIFNTVQHMQNFNLEDFENLDYLIRSMKELNNESSYFWDWMEEKGHRDLCFILQESVHDSKELLELLNYREMLLEMDAENEILDSYFISVADTITALKEFVIAEKEEAAAEDKLDSYHNWNNAIIHDENKKTNNFNWTYEYKNPAEQKQDFLL